MTTTKRNNLKAEKIHDFSAFYHSYERLIRSTLFHLVGRNDLDDLVQQTFIRCWQSYDQFDGRSKASTWITRIAINLSRDHWRKMKGDLKALDAEAEADVVDERTISLSERREDRQAIETALKSLSFEHRSVVALLYFQEMSLEEISEVTGDPVGTVKSRLHYARVELRRLLKKMGVEA